MHCEARRGVAKRRGEAVGSGLACLLIPLSRRFQPSPFRSSLSLSPAPASPPSGLPRPPLASSSPPPPRTTVSLPWPLSAFQPLDEPASASLRGRSAHPRPYIVVVIVVVVRYLPPLPAPSCRTSAFQPLTYLPSSTNQQSPRRWQWCRIAVCRRKRNLPTYNRMSFRDSLFTDLSILLSFGKGCFFFLEKNNNSIFFNMRGDPSSHIQLRTAKLCCREFVLYVGK